jgi:predicted CopG family antitoxin
VQLKYESHLVAPARKLNGKKSGGREEGEVQTPSVAMTKNIKVSDDVHKALGELGKLSESYNDVVKRLIDEHYKNEHYKRSPMKTSSSSSKDAT